jgi:hypothetical protein
MMKFLTIGGAVVVVAVVGVLILAASKPDEFRVARATTIKAPPERIAAAISDFRGWQAWSPYEAKDPAMKRSFSGAATGKGAVYEWQGNGNVGKGRMEITDASRNKVTIKLDFEEPMTAHNVAEFTLTPRGEATEVTWSMHGPTPFIGKVIHVFLDMDRMVGDDFAAGLAKLKALAEG